MKFSDYIRKGAALSLPAKSRYIVHAAHGSKPRACAIGAAVIGKVGLHAHCVSLTEVRKEFPDIPGHLLLKVMQLNDRPYRGEQMTREEIADWLEERGF